MFRDELAALKDRYLDRFNLVHVLSREAQDIELLHGRIDRAKADALLEHWVPVDDVDYAFVCGPEGMMDAVRASLKAHGMPPERDHGSSASPPASRSTRTSRDRCRRPRRPNAR